MKLIAVPILIFLLITQTFSKYFVMLSFQLNRDYIAKNLCENRYRPQLHCKGNCVLMKKIKQEQKQEQNAPCPGKTEISTIILSSRSFFAAAVPLVFTSTISYVMVADSGKPIDRAFSIFHPPVA